MRLLSGYLKTISEVIASAVVLERVKLKKTLLSKEEEMKKKFFSVLLAGLITVVSLTGCSALNDAIRESEQEIEETKEQLAKDVQDIPEIKIE